jgi:hypothetical protein
MSATLAYLHGNTFESSTNISPELMVDTSGTIFMQSPLSGGYHPIAHISDYGYSHVNELRGLDGIEELDNVLHGFKFKMPKMKIKAPKIKMKAPKMKMNTKGISKGISSAGKAVSNAGKAYGKAWEGIGKGAGKLLTNVGKGVGQLAESLLSEGQGQEQEEEQPEEEQTDEIQDQENLDNQEANEDIPMDENSDNTIGCQIDSQGTIYKYSPIDQKLVTLSGEELGFMEMLSKIASTGASGGKSGLLSLATTGLDAFVPGAGTVANMGIGMAQKQKAAQLAKKKAQKAKQEALYKKLTNQRIAKQIPVKTQSVQRQTPIIQQTRFSSMAPRVSSTSLVSNPTSTDFQPEINSIISNRNQTDANPTVKEEPKGNNTALILGGAALVLVLAMSSSKKSEKE